MSFNNDEQQKNEDILLEPNQAEASSNQGVVGDSFSQINDIPVTEASELKDRFDKKEGIEVEYSFNSNQLKTALKIFQKHTIYKKYTIFSLILGLMFLLYLYRIIVDYTKTNMFMAILCLIVIAFIWYVPLNHIRMVAKGVEESGMSDKFKITFYDEGIKLGEDERSNIFEYEKDPLKTWETDDMFVIGYAKERVFIIPKECCEGNTEKIASLLQNGLNDRYKRL